MEETQQLREVVVAEPVPVKDSEYGHPLEYAAHHRKNLSQEIVGHVDERGGKGGV